MRIFGSSFAAALLLACGTSRQTAVPGQQAGPPAVEPAQAGDATGKMVAAAREFLAALDEKERARASFAFESDQKYKWSNFPEGIYPRNGVRFGDLNAAQKEAAQKLLSVALSPQGLVMTQQIMDGDEVLKKTGSGFPGGPGGFKGPPPGGSRGPPPGGPGGFKGPPPGLRDGQMRGPNFGRDEYHLAILGTPSLSEPWMIQFGGHHLALNLTVVGKRNVLTPSLPAAQPTSYQLNGETVRPLGRENDEAFALVQTLDAAQRKKAILDYQVGDLVLGPGEDGKTIQPEGIKASELSSAQQELLLGLAKEWVGIVNDEAANAKMAEIKANLLETWFAWSGPALNDGSAYFRIQGPTVLIEYSPQRRRGDGSGLDANHVHTIYRDPANDYGARLVKR